MRITELTPDTLYQLYGMPWKELTALAKAIGVHVKSDTPGRPSAEAVRESIERHIRIYGAWKRSETPAPEPMPTPAPGFTPVPLCPRCGTPMEKKMAHRGPNAGNHFWGCPRYPECKGTRDYVDAPAPGNSDAPLPGGFNPTPATPPNEYPATVYCPNADHPAVPILNEEAWRYGKRCGVCGSEMTTTPPAPVPAPAPNNDNAEYIGELEREITRITERADAADERIKAMTPNTEHSADELYHVDFDRIASAVRSGKPVYLMGLPGTGKSEMGRQLAAALDMPKDDDGNHRYIPFPCTNQMTEGKLFGFVNVDGVVRTGLRECVEHGGLYVLDEADNGNGNLIAGINTLISNDLISFPGKVIRKHEEFRLILTANTWGTGDSAEYLGRQGLDKATLDRVVRIPVPIDPALEMEITRRMINPDVAETIVHAVWTIRERVEEQGAKILVTPRMSYNVAALMVEGWSMADAFGTTSLATLDDNTRRQLTIGINGLEN